MVQHGGVLETLIAELRSSVSGELSSRSQVVDHLLDLRLAARSNPTVVAAIDALLADLPGQTTVPNGWWLGGLADIERAWRNPPMVASRAGGSSATTASAGPERATEGGTGTPLPKRIRPEQ